nr:testis-expressed protein 36 isoform X2 [Pogona vitticeps]
MTATVAKVVDKFSHIGNPHINPESLTATMQKQILNKEAAHQIEKRLPQMYKEREKFIISSCACGYGNCLAVGTNAENQKKPVNTFPFSVHDNRHCLLNEGEYLDSGLGLRKFQQELCQHHSQDYFLEAQEPFPSDTSHHSIYQTSFVQYPHTERSPWGRFPKSHVDRCVSLKRTAENECLWFSKCYATPNNLAPSKSNRNFHSKSKQLLPAEEVMGVKEDSKENSSLDGP